MAEFKLCIGDPKSGKSYQKEVKDAEAQVFMGLNIGESLKGDTFGMDGYEFTLTGGSDFCGFPMRSGIQGIRKKISSAGGVGFPKLKKSQRVRKTVCGHKVNEKISQINLRISKAGAKKVDDIFGGGDAPKDAPAEGDAPKEDAKEAPKEDKKE